MTTIDCHLILEDEHNFQARIRLLSETKFANLKTDPFKREGMMTTVQQQTIIRTMTKT